MGDKYSRALCASLRFPSPLVAPQRWSELVSGLFPAGTEAVAAPGKASAGDKQPSAAGDREELTKDEILQKNREEFFKRHMKAGEKSRWVTRTRSVYPYFRPALPGVPWLWLSLSFLR